MTKTNKQTNKIPWLFAKHYVKQDRWLADKYSRRLAPGGDHWLSEDCILQGFAKGWAGHSQWEPGKTLGEQGDPIAAERELIS